MTFDSCNVAGSVILRDAEIPDLFLDDTAVKSIDGDRARCRGSIYINAKSSIDGFVSFGAANIDGDLDCTGAQFLYRGRYCLYGEGVVVKGSVFLGDEIGDIAPFHAAGRVNFRGSRIDGDVRCGDAQFDGAVWFIGAQVKGDVDFSRCHFTPSDDEPPELVLTRADIAGRLYFRRVTGQAARFILRATTVGALVDDMASWKVAEQIMLDGFRYNRFLDSNIEDEPGVWTPHESPTDAATRIEWLKLQKDKEFKPQPWEQLIKVLRDIGHQEGARLVAIAKQKQIRKSTLRSAVLHRVYGLLCAYGYRPARLIVWAAAVAALWAALFEVAARMGVMGPTDWHILAETTDIGCRPESGGNWTTCPSLHRRGYPSFDPIVYSIDLIVPVIATQQTKDWGPIVTLRCQSLDRYRRCERPLPDGVVSTTSGYWPLGVFFWVMARIETLLGWAFGLMFVAIVSGLVKRD
jgi:hypothetical protein